MKFEIIVETKKDEFELGLFNEKETIEILGGAYKCIENEKEEVAFGELLKVYALDLKAFYIKPVN